MPNGYTMHVKDGITFEEFIMGCTRAFLIETRDTPNSQPIPEKMIPSEHHQNQMILSAEEKQALLNMSDSELEIAANIQYVENVKSRKKNIDKKIELKAKFDIMLLKVTSWEPPSSDHNGLKDFMKNQLTESRDFDCKLYGSDLTEIVKLTGNEWKKQELQIVNRSIDYHTKEHALELKRINGNNNRLKQLRDSI